MVQVLMVQLSVMFLEYFSFCLCWQTPKFVKVFVYCALSLALREIAKPMASLAEARRCLDLIPDYAGAWNLIGNAEIDLGHYREAHQAYAEAVRLKPMYGNARFNLGLALGALGRDAEAELAFQETLRQQPGMADAWAKLGESQLRQEKKQAALESFKEASRLDPLHADTHWGMARACLALGRKSSAAAHEKEYRRLIREADNRTFFKKGDKQRREAALQAEAWARETNDPR
jgi:cytochrome c-type biogenesis protein CcmH/NrfG